MNQAQGLIEYTRNTVSVTKTVSGRTLLSYYTLHIHTGDGGVKVYPLVEMAFEVMKRVICQPRDHITIIDDNTTCYTTDSSEAHDACLWVLENLKG